MLFLQVRVLFYSQQETFHTSSFLSNLLPLIITFPFLVNAFASYPTEILKASYRNMLHILMAKSAPIFSFLFLQRRNALAKVNGFICSLYHTLAHFFNGFIHLVISSPALPLCFYGPLP